LYYRFQANVLQVPPLRARLEDVPLLADYFIALLNERLGRTIFTEGIDQAALDALSRYKWPGNVRELANAIEGAMTFGTDTFIRLEDLPSSISRIEILKPSRPAVTSSGVGLGIGTFADVERDLILRALEACDWNKVHAAAMLKISRKKLYAKIKKYQLQTP